MPAYAMPDAHLLAECDATSSSTHSPGGQHRNKAESAVRLRHRPSGLVAQCEAHRDRVDNRAEALRRLRLRLALQERGVADPAWAMRGGDAPPGPDDDGFALVVAACLDALTTRRGALADAARDLGLSTSRLSRILCADKEVMQAANRIRAESDLKPIHPAHR